VDCLAGGEPLREVPPAGIRGVKALVTSELPPAPEAKKKVAAAAPTPSGVVMHDPARSFAGLTLVVVGQGAHLVDMDGTVRHTWQLGYDRLRDGKELQKKITREERFYWRPARAFPNGDLMAVVDLKKSSPEGLAIVRMDCNSHPIWVYHGHVHHDFDIAPDGRVFVLGMGVRAEPPAKIRGLVGPMIDERLLILSPKGELQRDISLIDAFVASPYRQMVRRNAGYAST